MKLPDPCSVGAVIGAAALLFGVWKMSHASAWIVGGMIILCASFLISAGRSRREKLGAD